MAIRPVMTIGNPVLRKVARDLTPVEIRSDQTRALVEDMIDTMHHEEGIGIAAPQIGESVQLAIIQIDVDSNRYPDSPAFDLSVIINPRIRVLDRTEQGYWEGCLSVPNMRGEVWRPRKVRVDYLDLDAQPQSIEAEGFLATVFQHELDHLQGVLFLDRIRDTRKLATIDDYARYWLNKPGELHMPD
ncbi:MAG TPA: peptide deformylase [Candidatus Limnocylindrales bacterium]|nr:peptide deformylase [Candidatus Limnocylindrales bacterium]